MNRDDLHIHEPCHEDWDQMTGDAQHRHCEHCVKDVHHLSKMTRDEAEGFLENNHGQKICVRYECDDDGSLLFKDSPKVQAREQLGRQQRGLTSLLAAGAMILPFSDMGACNMSDVFSPLDIGGEEVMMGEIAVEPLPIPEPREEVMGKIALEPEPEPVKELMGDVIYQPPPKKVEPKSDRELFMGQAIVMPENFNPEPDKEAELKLQPQSPKKIKTVPVKPPPRKTMGVLKVR